MAAHKLTLFACLLCLVATGTTPAAAQPRWTMGFKGGPALATLGGDEVQSDEVGTRTAFAGGVFAQVDVTRNFGLRMEGLYHMKGAEADSALFAVTFKFDYLEFPVLLVGQVPANENVTLGAFAGPVIGFNTNAEIEASVGYFSGSADISDYIASFEFSLAFGLGAAFNAGSVEITLDGRYQLGLTTVDDGLLDPAQNADIKNRDWVFMAGLGFPIGGR